MDRLIEKTQAKNTNEEATTKYTYDNASNLIAITNAKGVKIYYQYNTLNQKIKKINADNTIIEYTYDKNANLIQQTNEDGTVISYTYDTLNRKINTGMTPKH